MKKQPSYMRIRWICRFAPLLLLLWMELPVPGWALPAIVPFSRILVSSDCAILGVIQEARAKESPQSSGQIGKKTEWVEDDFSDQPDLTITVRIGHSVPSIAEESLTFSGKGSSDGLVGRTMIVFLERKNGVVRPLGGSLGWHNHYTSFARNGHEAIVLPLFGSSELSLDDAWETIGKLWRRAHTAQPPNHQEGNAWITDLTSATLTKASLAWELLKMEPHPVKVGSAVMASALETQYARLREEAGYASASSSKSAGNYRSFALSLLDAMIASPDDVAVSRTLALFVRDLADLNGMVFCDSNFRHKILRLVMASPTPARADRLRSILGRPVEQFDSLEHPIQSVTFIPWDTGTRAMLMKAPGQDVQKVREELDRAHPEAMKP